MREGLLAERLSCNYARPRRMSRSRAGAATMVSGADIGGTNADPLLGRGSA
jgi:hypothetical protein